MIKTILIIAGVIVGAPIALFILFVVVVIINFLNEFKRNDNRMPRLPWNEKRIQRMAM